MANTKKIEDILRSGNKVTFLDKAKVFVENLQ